MVRPKKYVVRLSDEQVKELKTMLKKQDLNETQIGRIRVLLRLDVAHNKNVPTNEEVAKICGVSKPTVSTTARLFCNEGLDGVLTLKRNPNSDLNGLKLDGKAQARLLALACSEPPEGRARWTVRLLSDASKVVVGEQISPSTISRFLKKSDLKPHKVAYYCIPRKADGEMVARMEKILDTYELPYNPDYPVVCMDEKPYPLHADVVPSKPVRVGNVKKVDYEYQRKGTCSIFLFIEPKTGLCYASARERRTAIDWAYEIRDMVNRYPNAKKILLVMDNLSTHKLGSLYKAFPPEEAHEIAQKLVIIPTPVHASWLNIAEIGLNKLERECLKRRIDSLPSLQKELAAWTKATNAAPKMVNWHFTTKDAQVKLAHLYPRYAELVADKVSGETTSDDSSDTEILTLDI